MASWESCLTPSVLRSVAAVTRFWLLASREKIRAMNAGQNLAQQLRFLLAPLRDEVISNWLYYFFCFDTNPVSDSNWSTIFLNRASSLANFRLLLLSMAAIKCSYLSWIPAAPISQYFSSFRRQIGQSAKGFLSASVTRFDPFMRHSK